MFYSANHATWVNKWDLFWICFVTGIVFLGFIAVAICFDSNGQRRHWLLKRSKQYRRDHAFLDAIPQDAGAPPRPKQSRARNWKLFGFLILVVVAIGLVGGSILVDHLTQGHQWFLINWRSFQISW